MSVLLDTNQVLIIVQDPARLTERARDILWRRDTQLYVSTVALWEIDLKHRATTAEGASRLPLDAGLNAIVAYFTRKGARLLPLEAHHVVTALEVTLPHKDPFDWMLVKQAQAEGLTLLSSDRQLADHPLVISV